MDSPTFIKNALEVFDPVGYKYASAQTGTGASNFIKNGVIFPHEVPMYAYANGEISEAEHDAQLAVLAGRDWYSDYSKYMMSSAWLTRHQVSIEGGTSRSRLFSSVGYEGDQGTSKDFTGTVKMNLRGVVDVNKWLRVDMGINASLAKNNGHVRMGYGAGRAVTNRANPSMTSLPYAAFYDEDGNALDHSVFDMSAALKSQAEAALGKSLDYHPAEDFEASMVRNTTTNIRANAGITIKLFDGLKYEGRFAYSRSNSQQETYLPDYTYFVIYERGTTYDKTGKVQYGPANGGDLTSADSFGSDWTVRNQLNLDRTFDERHHVAAIAGIEVRENHLESNQNLQLGYDYQSMTSATYDITKLQKTLTSAILSPAMGSTGTMLYAPRINKFETTDAIFRYFSMYANAAYTFDGRYSLNASVRVDQSNLFGTDSSVQFKPVWSVGGIWHAKKESFLRDVEWLNSLSVRASYGLGGNSPVSTMGGPYNILTSGTPYQNMATGVTYYINSPANDQIHWEKTATTNAGIDFVMFKHRLYGSIDVYLKDTLLNIDYTKYVYPDRFADFEAMWADRMKEGDKRLAKVKDRASIKFFRRSIASSVTHSKLNYASQLAKRGLGPADDADYMAFFNSVDLSDEKMMRSLLGSMLPIKSSMYCDTIPAIVRYLQAIDELAPSQHVKDSVTAKYIDSVIKDGKFSTPYECNVLLGTAESLVKDEEVLESYRARIAKTMSLTRGSDAIDFPLVDVNGNTVHLSDFKGRVVYIDFWATWCIPCCMQIPFMKEIAEKYASNPEVACLSVSFDEKLASWKSMLAYDKPAWPQYVAENGGAGIMEDYGFQAIPRFMIFDKEGKIVTVNAPRPQDKDEVVAIIDSLL